jgi:predicted O-methyltransferase YrrM
MFIWAKVPTESPRRIFTLRDSSFAADLFFAAISHFDFFNRLAESPADFSSICNTLQIKPRPADVMLTLFKSYGFIREKQGQYYITDVSRDFLMDTSFFNLTSYVNSLKDRPICEEMVKVLKTGIPANWAAAKNSKQWAALMEDNSYASSFTAGMNSRGAYLASGLAKVLDLSGYEHMLDIGGASGIYSAVILKKYADLRATVFEKPPVDNIARYSLTNFGLKEKVSVIGGDMFKDHFPPNYDIHFISHVLHDWDIKEVKTVLKNSFENLAPGGKLIIHDAHINRTKTGPISIAEYSVLLMFLSEGKCYSIAEMKHILEEAGFRNVQYKPTVLNRSIITADK